MTKNDEELLLNGVKGAGLMSPFEPDPIPRKQPDATKRPVVKLNNSQRRKQAHLEKRKNEHKSATS